MKKARAIHKANDPPTKRTAPFRDEETQESRILSTERILDGASTTTSVLNEILAQRDEQLRFRHWGINE